MVTRSLSIASVALCLGTYTLLSQEQPGTDRQRTAGSDLQAFLGTWDLDPARTKVGSNTFLYEQAGDSIRSTNRAGTYTFKIDGKDYPTVPGDTISWKQVDKNTIETTVKRNGKVQSVSTRVFAPDGKTIMITTKRASDQTTVRSTMARQDDTAGVHPLIGTWKQRPDPSSTRTARLTYTAGASDLQAKYEGLSGQEYTLVFDGQPHPVESAGPNVTLSAKKINDHTIEETWTRGGKLFNTSTISVAADGQQLTEQHQPGDAHDEPSLYVYRRAK